MGPKDARDRLSTATVGREREAISGAQTWFSLARAIGRNRYHSHLALHETDSRFLVGITSHELTWAFQRGSGTIVKGRRSGTTTRASAPQD